MSVSRHIRIAALIMAFALTAAAFSGCGKSSSSEASDKPQTVEQTTVATMTVTVVYGDTKQTVAFESGTVAKALEMAGFDTENYSCDAKPDDKAYDGMVITVKDKVEEGFFTDEDGKTYYYVDGTAQKDTVVGNEEEGFFYANSEGVIDYGYCAGVTVDGTEWNVINGKASIPESDGDLTLNRALKAVAKCTNSGMSKQEKLRAAFDYLKTAYLEGVRHDPPYKELDWPIIYANDIFVYGKGDCFSYGAAFAYMGKALGCSDCYACNSGGHGWAEIEGLVYDPEWDMHHPEYDHFAVDYDNNDTDVNYKRGIAPGAEYMHVAV